MKAAKKAPAKKAAAKAEAKPHRVYAISVASVYPHYLAKAEKKGRTQAEVDQIIRWLTGYTQKALEAHLKKKTTFQDFFAAAPKLNPARDHRVICGVRIENRDRWCAAALSDKLIDKVWASPWKNPARAARLAPFPSARHSGPPGGARNDNRQAAPYSADLNRQIGAQRFVEAFDETSDRHRRNRRNRLWCSQTHTVLGAMKSSSSVCVDDGDLRLSSSSSPSEGQAAGDRASSSSASLAAARSSKPVSARLPLPDVSRYRPRRRSGSGRLLFRSCRFHQAFWHTLRHAAQHGSEAHSGGIMPTALPRSLTMPAMSPPAVGVIRSRNPARPRLDAGISSAMKRPSPWAMGFGSPAIAVKRCCRWRWRAGHPAGELEPQRQRASSSRVW